MPDIVNKQIAVDPKGDFEKGFLNFSIERADEFTDLTLKMAGKTFAIIKSNGVDGKAVIDLSEIDNITFTGDVSTGKGEAFSDLQQEMMVKEDNQCFMVKGNKVTFEHPKTKAQVTLDRHSKPGVHTPENVPPVIGMDEMLFTIALGIDQNRSTLLSGPTGTAKTTAYMYIAQILNYNFVRLQVSPKTEAQNLVGEYLPAGQGLFEWTDGPVTEAARLSQTHRTILIFDEISRVGNVAEFARVYSLMDDDRKIYLPERRHDLGEAEVVAAKDLYIGATMNPIDDGDYGADYIGVRELDPALLSRFSYMPAITYPKEDLEVATLRSRVPGLKASEAKRMVAVANRVRTSTEVSFPFSFRELLSWANALPYYGWAEAAEISFVRAANPTYWTSMRDIIKGLSA